MIRCHELNKSFETKEQMFKALARSANDIIALKTANIYNSVDKGQLRCPANIPIKIHSVANKSVVMKDGYIYAVINTTNYIDSHSDVHIPGIWNKSAKEQNGKTFYVMDHELSIASTIAWKSDVNIMVQDIEWSSVGKDYQGQTEALIFEIEASKLMNDLAANLIKEKKDVENSIRMQYVSMKLAVNSTDPELREYKATFDQYINIIANKEVALEQGYFWAVTEAKIVKEGSMVLAGSNDATGILSVSEKEQPSLDTEYKEPVNTTHQKAKAKRKAALEALSNKINQTLKA